MSEWIEEFEHESVTDDNREAFTKAMGKYNTVEDAVVGGFNAQKIAGLPFKLPETLDKLKDEKVRADFVTQTHKVLGIQNVSDIKDLDDLDLKAGLAEDAPVNEGLAKLLKEHAVKQKWPKSVTQDIVGLFNGPFSGLLMRMQMVRFIGCPSLKRQFERCRLPSAQIFILGIWTIGTPRAHPWGRLRQNLPRVSISTQCAHFRTTIIIAIPAPPGRGQVKGKPPRGVAARKAGH